MRKKISTNVLLIGKSGVGKSSLVNYLLGEDVEETGTGEPVTGKGIFPHRYTINDNFDAIIYDSWGLEPDKTKEWLELINNEIVAHDSLSVKDWFHTIFYCINSKADRVQDFEIKFINQLIETGNNLFIVITNSEEQDNQATPVEKYLEALNLKERLIRVNNKCVTKISGKSVHRFGREEVLKKIIDGLWKSICENLPKKTAEEASIMLDRQKNKLKNQANEKINFFNAHWKSTYKSLNEECEKKVEFCHTWIKGFYRDHLKESIAYYIELSNNMFPASPTAPLCFQNHQTNNSHVKYTMDKSENIAEDIAYIIVSMIPILNLGVPYAFASSNKERYFQHIDKVFDELEKENESFREIMERELLKYQLHFEEEKK